MSDMMAYCGLDCSVCGAYKATVANDDEMRKQTAKEWSEMFGAVIEYSDINCLGCKSDMLIGNCKVCGIRSCGTEKSADNCAVCNDYGCSKITEFLTMAPEAKKNLEKIRNG